MPVDRQVVAMMEDAKRCRDEDGNTSPRADAALELARLGIHRWTPIDANPIDVLADPSAFGIKVDRVIAGAADGGDDGAPRVRRGGEAASNQFGTFTVHNASAAQIGFVKRLLAERDWESRTDVNGRIVPPADIDTISKKAASALIDRLTACPMKSDVEGSTHATARPASRLATDKAMGFLRKLIAERDYLSLVPADRAKVDFVNGGGTPTARGASELIDVLKVTAYATATSADALELGMYRKADGTLYRVYPGRESGRVLAKRLVLPEAEGEKATFEYAGLASRFVTADERMSLEEAQAFGHQFGICAVCGALLTDPTSVANGIGPICNGKV